VIGLIIEDGATLLAFRIRHSRFYKYISDWTKKLYHRKFKSIS